MSGRDIVRRGFCPHTLKIFVIFIDVSIKKYYYFKLDSNSKMNLGDFDWGILTTKFNCNWFSRSLNISVLLLSGVTLCPDRLFSVSPTEAVHNGPGSVQVKRIPRSLRLNKIGFEISVKWSKLQCGMRFIYITRAYNNRERSRCHYQ